jgi:hypothetical protein
MSQNGVLSAAELSILRPASVQYHCLPPDSRERRDLVKTTVTQLQEFPNWSARRVRLWLNNANVAPPQPEPSHPPENWLTVFSALLTLQPLLSAIFTRLETTCLAQIRRPPAPTPDQLLEALADLFSEVRLEADLVSAEAFHAFIPGLNPLVQSPTEEELRQAIARREMRLFQVDAPG